MKLIVGLGNPGQKYYGTRHNVGFRVIAELHERFGKPRPSSKFDSELVQVRVSSDNPKVLLQSPLTYMNESGRSVRGAVDFYKIALEDILIICDDFHLDLERLRFRPGGSAGGQNGLKDVIRRLASEDFSRLRIGVGKPPAGWDVANYVLSKFTADEQANVDQVIKRAADAAIAWLEHGTSTCMNRYNADPGKPKPEKKRPPADTNEPSRPPRSPQSGNSANGSDVNRVEDAEK